MKLHFLLALIAIANCNGETLDETLKALEYAKDGEINVKSVAQNVLDTVRDILQNGLASLGIPPLDPIHQAEFNIDLDIPLIALKVEGYEASVSGISSFVVDSFVTSRSNLTIEFIVRIPLLSIKAPYYNLDGSIYGAIPFYGRGGVSIDVKDITIRGKAYLRRAANLISIAITEIQDARVLIGSVDSKLSGVLGGGDLDLVVNSMIEDLVPMYVGRFSGILMTQVLTPVITLLNRVLFIFPTWALTFLFGP